MKKWVLAAAGVALTAGLPAEPAAAQVQFGLQANYADEFDLGLGIRAQRGLVGLVDEDSPMSVLTGVVSLDYYFPSCGSLDCSYFELNGNALYPLDLGEGWAPYVGGGLHLGRFWIEDFPVDGTPGRFERPDTKIGLNAVGGAIFDIGGMDAFAEAKLGLGGWEHFVLRFGVLIGRD